MRPSRLPHLARRAAWLVATRVAGWFGVSPQRLHSLRQRIWKLKPFNAKLAARILALPPVPPPERTRHRVVHLIGSLGAGGSERQLVNLARETARRGEIDVRILTTSALVGGNAHYLPLAQNGGVTVEVMGISNPPEIARRIHADRSVRSCLAALSPVYRQQVTELTRDFVRLQPDVVHAWLDHANIWGGIAAFLAGVPSIVLSTRAMSPPNFPMLDALYFLPWYQRFAASSRVRLLANSRAGANDYAAWMGVDPGRFTVIPNGFDPNALPVSSEGMRAQLRDELGLGSARVVLGVFRISEEKEPGIFAQAAELILRANADAFVCVAGDGPLRRTLEARAAAIDAKRFRVLGRRDDIAALISIADVVLHASRTEGAPNALIEAQALGCPVVATSGGGTADAVEHEGSGFLCAVGDADDLARRALQILDNPVLRARMSKRAQAFVRSTFALDQMVDRSVACYASTLKSPRE